MGFPVLSLLIFLPIAGALWVLFAPGGEAARAQNARVAALVVTLLEFALAILVWVKFDNADPAFQFTEYAPLFAPYFAWHLGIDGIALLLIVLTAFLMPLCILASWTSIKTRVPEYMAAFLLMESLMFGVFASLDLFLFYLFFEGGLIPMYLIIGIWGGARRIYASYKFFLYTLLGSVLMLLAMLYMVGVAGTTDIRALMAFDFDPAVQTWLWLAFFASFAVKMPMWPVHTWLPDAHVEAPTAGSVILAGVLLKMGGYGFVRFSLPMFPDASAQLMWLVFGLSMVAVVYTSLVALVQNDMKKLIAYSSVAHMGYVTMGIFAANQQGVEGAIFQMLSHGFISGALFLCVGVIYDRMHTREIDAYGGLVNRMPAYALVFMFFTMANVGLPGTSGFIGEFLTLAGIFQVNTWVAAVATSGVILSAAYALWLYRRVVFGDLIKESLRSITDMTRREKAIFAPLIAMTLLLGVYPSLVTDITGPSVANLVTEYQAALPVATATQIALH